MSSGTFAYPLCFTALLFAIGLMVLPRSDHARVASNDAGPAAIEKNSIPAIRPPLNLKIAAELIARCDEFLRKYPAAEQAEDVAMLAGEVRVERGLTNDWKEIGNIYRDLEAKFPKSANLERYVFYQGVAFFQEASFNESARIFTRFRKDFPNSQFIETALYYMAMSNFLSNNYKETLATCSQYLAMFPDGYYAGDMTYRIAFFDFNDKEDQSEKIIRNLTAFLKRHPQDAVAGSMYCLLGDVYQKKDMAAEAIEAYKKAVKTDSWDDVITYALDSATTLMKVQKDWKGIAEMLDELRSRKPDFPSISGGKSQDAADMIMGVLKTRIADPAQEMVEYLIDELVKTLVPKKKPVEINADELDQQLCDILTKACAGKENPTTAARTYYARARLAQMLKRNDRADLYLNGIATLNAKNPSVLSPALLSVCGDILFKTGDLDGAEAMFQYLADHYKESNYSDAGPVGLGYVALARKKPEEALKVFNDALETMPGMSHFKEASLGKVQALVDLDRLDEAEKQAMGMIGNKAFRGETTGKAYLLLGRIYRKKAVKADGEKALEFLKKAYAVYQRVYIAYAGFPEICADGYWQAYETAKELKDDELAKEALKQLMDHQKAVELRK